MSPRSRVLIGAGNRLFLLAIYLIVTSYHEKKMFPKLHEIIDTAFKIHCI